MAVKLAEELIGKSIASADGNTFIDTSDTYVLKVYAAGIMSGVSTTEFDQNGTLTRQQMGAFLYRTLRYVKQNSELKYTSYNSKLDSYTDSWAGIRLHRTSLSIIWKKTHGADMIIPIYSRAANFYRENIFW